VQRAPSTPVFRHARGTEPQLSGRTPTSGEWIERGRDAVADKRRGLKKEGKIAPLRRAKHALSVTPAWESGDVAPQAKSRVLRQCRVNTKSMAVSTVQSSRSVDAGLRFASPGMNRGDRRSATQVRGDVVGETYSTAGKEGGEQKRDVVRIENASLAARVGAYSKVCRREGGRRDVDECVNIQ
jgi:hypothetical protein